MLISNTGEIIYTEYSTRSQYYSQYILLLLLLLLLLLYIYIVYKYVVCMKLVDSVDIL
jgi:hypothetical protein